MQNDETVWYPTSRPSVVRIIRSHLFNDEQRAMPRCGVADKLQERDGPRLRKIWTTSIRTRLVECELAHTRLVTPIKRCRTRLIDDDNRMTISLDAAQMPARLNVTWVTPLGEEVASTW